jgi:Skp family chaperone for outer membrane proteins
VRDTVSSALTVQTYTTSIGRSFQRESQALCLDPLVALAEAELRRRHKRRREEEEAEEKEAAKRRREELAREREESKRQREREDREKEEHEWRRREHELREEEAERRRREEGPLVLKILGYMRHLRGLAEEREFVYGGAGDTWVEPYGAADACKDSWIRLVVKGPRDTVYYCTPCASCWSPAPILSTT